MLCEGREEVQEGVEGLKERLQRCARAGGGEERETCYWDFWGG